MFYNRKRLFIRHLTAALLLIFAVPAPVNGIFAAEKTEIAAPERLFLLGDADMNGAVNSVDARLALRASAQVQELDEAQELRADYDENGKTTSSDARCILRIGAKLLPFGSSDQLPSPQKGDPARKNKPVELQPFSEGNDFQVLFTTEELHGGKDNPYGDPEGSYFLLQGACTDGIYGYFSFIMKCYGATINARIVCAEYKNGAFRLKKLTVFGEKQTISDEDGNPVVVNSVVDVPHNLFHANDIAYNSVDDVIAVQYDGGHTKIGLISAAKLRTGNSGDVPDFREQSLPLKIGSIDYCEALKSYILGVAGKARYFALADRNFERIRYFGYPNAVEEEDCGRQSVCSAGRYIYAVHYILRHTGNEKTPQNIDKSRPVKLRVEKYDLLTGKYIETIECRSTETKYIVEGENIFRLNGRLLLFVNYARTKKDRQFCFVDLSRIDE
ncbi:MAG: dockerin type I repeat-containing protein [Clostridia bacterium]|nr:dockerin type I repeat-containing protein [Clostridia bacterium]